MEEKFIAAVDLGSSKIALLVAKSVDGNIQMLFYKEWPSQGIRNGMVSNPSKVAGVLKKALEEVRTELQIKILQVVVNLPKYGVKQQSAEANIERNNPDECITQEEVDNIKDMAKEGYPLDDPKNEQLYAAIVQSFSDDENFQLGEDEIVGEMSRVLKGNFKLLIGRKNAIKGLEMLFNNLGLAIAKEYFPPCTMHKAVLSEEEMENGVALIDFGGGATSLAIYRRNILRHYAAIPFGGKVVTSDIKTECSVSTDLAENIKLAFGACLPDMLATMDEKIIQIEDLDIEDYKQIPVKYLSEIINAREKEIIDAILYEIHRSGFSLKLRSGLVITGGGAQITNLANMLRDISGYTVRLGMPRHLFTSEECPQVHTPSSTNAVGMALAAFADPHVRSCLDRPQTEAPKKGTPAAPKVIPPSTIVDEPREEGISNGLFGDMGQDEKEQHSEKEPRKTKWWKKFGSVIGSMYDGAADENNEENI